MENIPDYTQGIRETGFILEFKIAENLKKHKWNVISNKYYEDDLEASVREIDIIAYKSHKNNDVSYYTVLMISCKKSNDNSWVLLSRDLNLNDLNSDWFPLHYWSNDTALNNIANKNGFRNDYYKYLKDKSVSIMDNPEVDIFAFQEMNKKKGTPHNDKNIYNSIITLVKAQAYEIGSLDSRKKDKSLYQFNLISIIDSELYRLMFNGSDITQTKIETDQFISRYIVNRKEQFFKLRFVTANHFPELISDYNNLFKFNSKYFRSKRKDWFTNAITDYSKLNLLEKEFFLELYKVLRYLYNIEKFYENTSPFLSYEKKKDILGIYVTSDQDVSNKINQQKYIMEKVKDLLQKVFQYSGEFKFDSDILPF